MAPQDPHRDGPPAIPTRKLAADNSRQLLADKLQERIAEQPVLMDALARQLLTVELALPGLYAVVLKLLAGGGQLASGPALYLAFACWLAAIATTLAALFPRPYRGDPRILRGRGSPEDAFHRAARYKYRWLLAACCAFVLGLGATLYDGLAEARPDAGAGPAAAAATQSETESDDHGS